jgi:RNase H-fold protein (predicted Holliday junction resolvase)
MTNAMEQLLSPDKLATSSDKYLFFTALAGLVAFTTLVLRKLLAMHEAQQEMTKEAQKKADELRDKWENASEKFNLTVERNTQAFERAHVTMQDCRVTTDRAREVLQKFQ